MSIPTFPSTMLVDIKSNDPKEINDQVNKALNSLLSSLNKLSSSISIPFISAPEQLYVPTFTGFGVASAINFSWRQVANRVKVMGKFTCGTPTAVEARISLPNGMISDANLIPSIQVCLGTPNAPVTTSVVPLIESGVGYVTFGNTVTASLTKLNGNAFCTLNSVFSVAFELPVSGLNL